jgi:hypothetical protein
VDDHFFDRLSQALATTPSRRGALRALAVGALALAGRRASAGAQGTATPGALPGVAIDLLGEGSPTRTPDDVLGLLRISLEPGAVLPPHTRRGAAVASVLSGNPVVALTVSAGQLRRAGAAAAEPLAAGHEATLTPGDTLFHDEDAGFGVRNVGTGPAVLLLATLVAAGEPAFVVEAIKVTKPIEFCCDPECGPCPGQE